jgi:tetratricopeptide (TPR) repeat protein
MVWRQADRYHIHELLRQYGEEKLQASPAEATRVCDLHCAYYTDFLHSRLDDIYSSGQHRVALEIAAELENIRTAWQWAVTQHNVDAIHRAASTFFYFCQLKCYYLEGANALAEAAVRLKQQPASPQRDRTLAQVLNHEGWLRIRVGEFGKAEKLLQHSHTIYGRLETPPPPYMGADPATPLAIVSIIQGDYARAVALCESVRHTSEARGDQHNLSFAHYVLTAARLAQGEYEVAYQHAQRACALARAAGNRWFLAYPLNEWGKVARAGQLRRSRTSFSGQLYHQRRV